MNTPLITVDTNVYISALNFGGPPLDLLHAVLDGKAEVAVSEPILAEIRRVLRDKFEWNDYDLDEAEAMIRGFSKLVEPDEALYVVDADPSDNRIVECAAKSGSQFIVTGDKHLLALARYEGISIVTPAEFLTPARSIGLESPEH